MTKLRSSGAWTEQLLNQYYFHIEDIAKNDFGLETYTNQIEIISSQQMLDSYSTHAMPLMYDHWTFGRNFISNKTRYDKGHMHLAYEVVINSNPCIAYLMDENSIPMQALVIAHACFGHNNFFKENYLFKNWTEADFIIDYLDFAKKYIKNCEEKYGEDEVEATLDVFHSLRLYGVDKYKRNRPDSIALEKKKLEELLFQEKHYDQVISSTLPKNNNNSIEKNIKWEDIQFDKMEPEENLLYFLEKKAPYLKPWQREIARIVRKIEQYFYPQRQTQLMNEGWATFMHYNIINKMHEKGLVDDAFMLEFLESHAAVTAQPTFKSKYYSGVNVYSLGFKMFQDIKRISITPTAEDYEYFPEWAGNGDWLATTKRAMKNFRDESFIMQFLSPKIIRDYKLFSISDKVENDEYIVTNIHNERGYKNIRELLSNSFNIMEKLPDIQVNKVDSETRTLYLKHVDSKNKVLDVEETKLVLGDIEYLWKFPVVIESMTPDGHVYDTIGDLPEDP